jgi:SAM-dependent methyltransferase
MGYGFGFRMPTPDELTAQQKNQWSAAAAGWERWGDWFERNTGDLSSWLCEAASIGPGHRVLDLACGAGALVPLESALVGPQGRVTATDLSPDMVAVTRRKAQRLGLNNVDIQEMDAQALTFTEASFDAATCRFGLMFCPDPSRAASEIRRVLRPGGRFVLTVWDVPAKNPFFTVLSSVLPEFVPMPPPDPTAPGVFRLAPPGELERVLAGAGFSSIKVEPRPITLSYGSHDEYWQIMTEIAAPLRTAITTLSAADIERLRARVFEALKPHTDGATVRLAAVPLCASAAS